ncbi:tyrosine-type recombinase/integrase [Microbacterium paraoxydans]|uniref:tyrosine-type recombinase/integrase n=1 Tax=Microbacterium paraoxydans TaxID=199592 RepID=UPI003D74D7B7
MLKPQKLPSGRWRARIYRDGKKVSLGTYDTEAEAYESQVKAALYKEERRGNIKFWRYAEAHLMARKHDLSPGTWDNYMRDYRNHLFPTFGEKKLTDITPTMVRRWWSEMDEKPGPRRSAYMLLSNIMKQAVDDGEIQKWIAIRGASRDVSKKRKPVSVDTVKLLQMLSDDQQVATIIQVLVSSGLRIGEVLALDWEDVDLSGKTLRVNKHLTKFELAGGRKAHNDADVLQPITDAATASLRAWRDQGEGNGPVWRNKAGKRLTYYDWFKRWDELRTANGLKAIRTQDIRSTHLTAFASQSASLAEIMERGGHTDIRSALIYQRPLIERQAQLVKALEGIV